jgi:hypothetical protein
MEAETMTTHQLRLSALRPYFAEFPYYLWGQINYDSEGDCQTPTDRNWTVLELKNRETRKRLCVTGKDSSWVVEGEDPDAARAAHFLVSRCAGEWISSPPAASLEGWDHDRAMARANRVQMEFEKPELQLFDVGHWFWGSWKWVGWFATDFTWVGRWIMHSVVTNDKRAVNLCIEWLRAGPAGVQQSQALRYALTRLTGHGFATDREWVAWYDGTGVKEYPQPDFDKWYADLKAQVVID